MSIAITAEQFIEGLKERARRGAFFITIDALHDAKARKTNNPHGVIFKRQTVNGIANWSYEGAVNRQLLREAAARGDDELQPRFEPEARSWGHRLQGTPLVYHFAKPFLELKVQRVISRTFETAAGVVLDESAVEKFLPKKRSDAGRQGTENPIILRDFAIENILAATIDLEKYTLVHKAL